MSKTLFTSDLHFYHSIITRFTERGKYTTAEDHNQWLISLWNKQVRKDDTVYHLGDFCFRNKAGAIADIILELNGNIVLILGNHDDEKTLFKAVLDVAAKGCKGEHRVYQYKEIKMNENKWCLFHYPLSSWNKMHYGSYSLHGHSHGSFKGQGKILDVGLDNAYNLFGEHRFFTVEDIETYMSQQDIVLVDHHKRSY